MSKKQIIGLVVAVVLFGIGSLVSLLLNATFGMVSTSFDTMDSIFSTGDYEDYMLEDEEYIGKIYVTGVIESQYDDSSLFSSGTQGYKHDDTIGFIDMMIDDDYNAGIMLYVDSPGGAVYESEELYQKIIEYKESTGRPVWTYMAHYAASGGYYVAAPSDKITANINTTTGSIGVIISGFDMSGLYEKLGIQEFSITSGVNKDSSQMTDSQMDIYQSIVDETHNRFVTVVEQGRGLPRKDVEQLADGRIYTATQALELGLIDQIASYEEMEEAMMNELDVYYLYTPSRSTSIWDDFFSAMSEIMPKSDTQVLTEVLENIGSGVPMYYANELR